MANEIKEKQKPLELLTCSVDEYVRNKKVGITAYRFIGISTEDENPQPPHLRWENPRRYLIERALSLGCEVVVNLRVAAVPTDYAHVVFYSGTGLIRETEAEVKAEEEG
jgi:hypothetical protein